MSATPFKTAWTDPEYIRLASYRSPDDGQKAALRGPVPSFLDPWLAGSGELPDALRQMSGALPGRGDDYAAARCGCGHLFYADQQPGDPCRFCPCTVHHPGGAACRTTP